MLAHCHRWHPTATARPLQGGFSSRTLSSTLGQEERQLGSAWKSRLQALGIKGYAKVQKLSEARRRSNKALDPGDVCRCQL